MKKLVMFKSPTCGPCKLFAPVVKQVAEQIGAEYIEIDVSTDEETEKKHIEKLFERKHEEIEQMIQELKELQNNLNKDLKIFRKKI